MSCSPDASDAPQRLGAGTSAIYDNLKWALGVKRVLDNGLDATLRDLQAHRPRHRGLAGHRRARSCAANLPKPGNPVRAPG